jgi:uncharacterized protein
MSNRVTFDTTSSDDNIMSSDQRDDAHQESDLDSGPLRTCFASGVQRPKAELLRFVVGPDEQIIFDAAERLPGRGLWLTPERDIIETASSKRLFSRAARRAVQVPDGLLDHVAASLKRRCLDRLGLARRACLVAVGFEKVRAQATAGQTALILEASDGAEGGRRKVTGLAPDAEVIDAFTSAELGQAVGRDHAVHVGLSSDKLTTGLVAESKKYLGVANVVKPQRDD